MSLAFLDCHVPIRTSMNSCRYKIVQQLASIIQKQGKLSPQIPSNPSLLSINFIRLNNNCQMSYFQKHLKTLSTQPHEAARSSISSSQCAHKFKKNLHNKPKVAEVTVDETMRAHRKAELDQHALIEVNPRQVKPTRREDFKAVAKGRGEKATGQQFATNPHCQSDSMSRQLQTLMMEADNSMQELLNSSINQFTRYLQDKDPSKQNFYEQHSQLIQQNQHLRASLDQLKNILKSKLQHSLKKQKEELGHMMNDSFQLIAKLLNDKEEYTMNMEKLEKELKAANSKVEILERQARESRGRVEELAREKELHINNTKKQIDEFLLIINQYQYEYDQQGRECEQMKQRIQELEEQLRRGGQSSKVQSLLELLQRSQSENRELRETLHRISQSSDKISQLQAEYSARLQQASRQHQEQFMEYEKAVRETINKKDQCIQRLNTMLDELRGKRGQLESSLETTGRVRPS